MSHQTIDYRGLSVPERILLVEEIWDSIAEDSFKEPISALHKKELEKCVKEVEENPLDGEDWEVVLERIEKSL